MTAPTVSALVESKFCETAQTTQYTSSGVATIVDMVTLTNVSGSAVTFSLHIVAYGGSASSANKVISSQEVLPGRCYIADEACHTLNDGEFISTSCSAGSSLVLRVSGRSVA